MQEKLRISMPIICGSTSEKRVLSAIIDTNIIMSDNFAIFNEEIREAVIKSLAKDGVIVFDIPYFDKIDDMIEPFLPKEKTYHLGVDSTDETDEIIRLLTPFKTDRPERCGRKKIVSADLAEDGIIIREGYEKRRSALCKALGLPEKINDQALVRAISVLMSYNEYKELIDRIF